MTIQETHTYFNLVLDKTDTGYFSPEEIDSFLAAASLWLFTEYKPFYGKDRDKKAALLPFRESYDYNSNSSGLFSVVTTNKYVEKISGDVAVLDSDLGQTVRYDLDFVNEDELAERLNPSHVRKVSTEFPVAEETAPGIFQIYPQQTTLGTLKFLREPKTPKFNYTLVGRVITFQSSGSQDLEWKGVYLNKVIMKALVLAGVPLDSDWLVKNGMGLQQSNV